MTLRELWIRLTLRGLHFSNRHSRLNQLYRTPDPWNLNSEGERFRFQETNRLIDAAFGRPASLLEIGCGEGYQSEYLRRQCGALFGIDVSERAVERARLRLPDCQFETADLASSRLARDHAPFDVIVAAEVLYYMSDVRATLDQMESLGRGCLVTYYGRMAEKLDPILAERKGVSTDHFRWKDTQWTAYWWRSGRQ